MEELVIGKIKFNAWDLGGHAQGKIINKSKTNTQSNSNI